MKKGSWVLILHGEHFEITEHGSFIILSSLHNDRVIKYNLDMLLCFHVSLHDILLVSCILTFVRENKPKLPLWKRCSYLWIVECNLFKLKSCSCCWLIDTTQLQFDMNIWEAVVKFHFNFVNPPFHATYTSLHLWGKYHTLFILGKTDATLTSLR